MNIHILYKSIIGSVLMTLAYCGSNNGESKNPYRMELESKSKSYTSGQTVKAEIRHKDDEPIDSVVFTLDGDRIGGPQPNLSYSVNEPKLGYHLLTATVYKEGVQKKVNEHLTFLSLEKPKVYTYEIVATYPHDQEAFTQGLEFYKDTLYESTGLRKKSSLRKVDYTTGKAYKNIKVPDQYFAEGLTIVNDSLLQLTWQAGTGFIYTTENLEKIGDFSYNQSKEGWGLCNDGTSIYKSDGTERIWLLDPKTLAEKDYIQVTTNKGVKSKFNELEWVDGKIYANTYQKDGIAIINPKNGALEGVINLSGLRDKVTQHDKLDVLNGIAYKPDTKQLFVTGKNWDKLFEIKVIEK